MEKEAAIAHCQHDVTGTEVRHRATGDLDHFPRPKCGQHALPVNPQTKALTRSLTRPRVLGRMRATTQSLRHQSRGFRAATRLRCTRRVFCRQEVFRENWHWATVEPIFPQERASVSNTRSYRNAGFW